MNHLNSKVTNGIFQFDRKGENEAPVKLACDLWKETWLEELSKLENILSDENTTINEYENLPFTVPIHHCENDKLIATVSPMKLKELLDMTFSSKNINLKEWQLQLVRKGKSSEKIIIDKTSYGSKSKKSDSHVNKIKRLSSFSQSLEIKPWKFLSIGDTYSSQRINNQKNVINNEKIFPKKSLNSISNENNNKLKLIERIISHNKTQLKQDSLILKNLTLKSYPCAKQTDEKYLKMFDIEKVEKPEDIHEIVAKMSNSIVNLKQEKISSNITLREKLGKKNNSVIHIGVNTNENDSNKNRVKEHITNKVQKISKINDKYVQVNEMFCIQDLKSGIKTEENVLKNINDMKSNMSSLSEYTFSVDEYSSKPEIDKIINNNIRKLNEKLEKKNKSTSMISNIPVSNIHRKEKYLQLRTVKDIMEEQKAYNLLPNNSLEYVNYSQLNYKKPRTLKHHNDKKFLKKAQKCICPPELPPVDFDIS